MEIGETLDVTTAAEWRAWLLENHATKPEIWLVYHLKAAKRPSITYNDAVDEALCFGWIDSVVKTHGPTSRAQRFTPRRPGSPVSPMNQARIRSLIEAGRMTEAGIAAAGDLDDAPLVLAPDVEAALRADPEAWRHYESFPESYRRIRIGWIEGARRRPPVFETRLRYFVRMTKQGKRFGMVQ